jgi:hypothetical protein
LDGRGYPRTSHLAELKPVLDLLFAFASLFLLSVPLVLVAVFLLSAPFGAAMAYFVTEGPNGMAGFFQPDRGLNLGWPIGVQEEDAPRFFLRRPDEAKDKGPALAASAGSLSYPGGQSPSATRPEGLTPYGIAPTRIRQIHVAFVRRDTLS